MRWVEQLVENLLLLDLYGWELQKTSDPLKRILFFRFQRTLTEKEFRWLREFLKAWCNVNDCTYNKSVWKKYDFKAVIYLKGLGPLQNNNPMD